jgi:hypothetical protein
LPTISRIALLNAAKQAASTVLAFVRALAHAGVRGWSDRVARIAAAARRGGCKVSGQTIALHVRFHFSVPFMVKEFCNVS